MTEDRAETGRMQELLAQIGAGLDRFLEFEHGDAFAHRDHWRLLTQSLPRRVSVSMRWRANYSNRLFPMARR